MRKGILSLLVTAFAWSWPHVMIRMLRTDFDVLTQSFFRYVSASVFLFAVGLIFTRKNLAIAAGQLKILIIPAAIMAAHQMFFTAGVYMTSAVVSSLIGRLNAILIPAFSFILYEDERRVVGNKNFLLGAALALLGVVGVVLGKEDVSVEGFGLGVVFVLIGTLGWSIYAVYIKKLVRSIDPLSIIAFVSLISVFLFFPFVLIFGDIQKVMQVTTGRRMLLFGSGIVGVGIGNIFYYHAIKHVGTSIASVFFLLLPLSIGVISFFVLGEVLTGIQIASGSVLVLGCWVVIKLAKKENAPGLQSSQRARST